MADKRWKFVKVVNSLAVIEFDNEQYIEVKNNKHSDYCHRCDLYGSYKAVCGFIGNCPLPPTFYFKKLKGGV